MSSAGEAISGLAYAGVGAAISTIAVAFIGARSGKGEARAHAADMIAEAAGGLADRQAAAINRLEERLDRVVKAMIMLTAVDDELLEQLPMPVSERQKLQKAVHQAKLAI